MGSALVVLHVDGLGADSLEEALREGLMPFTKHLMDHEGSTIHRYRCGVPSTTPFAQAGIIYGDNSEIPSFRWWDRERRVLVQFGAGSTFKKVADKYFQGCRPLTEDGACIAACYPGGAKDDFGIAYQDRSYSRDEKSRSAWNVLLPYLANPLHIGDWAWQAAMTLARMAREYTEARTRGKHPARAYVISDALEEIFVHHLTRYAVVKAMREGYSPIYSAFYAFDETGHAFGPDDPSSLQILKHVDHSIRKVAQARGDRYELVVLSDHGQIETVPFNAGGARSVGEVIAKMLPGFRVQEMKGKAYGPPEEEAGGQVNVTSSGDLANALSSLEKIALVMARDGKHDVFMKGGSVLEGDELKALLARYDDADILLQQLTRLNSFQKAG